MKRLGNEYLILVDGVLVLVLYAKKVTLFFPIVRMLADGVLLDQCFWKEVYSQQKISLKIS